MERLVKILIDDPDGRFKVGDMGLVNDEEGAIPNSVCVDLNNGLTLFFSESELEKQGTYQWRNFEA